MNKYGQFPEIIVNSSARQLQTSMLEDDSPIPVERLGNDARGAAVSGGDQREIGVNGESLVAGSVLRRQRPNVSRRAIGDAMPEAAEVVEVQFPRSSEQ